MPEISSIGYYCNPLENEEQLHILEKFIDGAHLFNTNMVTTFAGALYSRPVEEAIPVYKKVFGELAKRAEANAYVFLLRTAQWAEHGAEQHTTSALIRVHGK